MGTVEKAREYARIGMSLYMDTSDEQDIYCEDLIQAYLDGAKAGREELTRWHDPKEELPEYAEVVEVKYKAFGKIMMAVAWRLGCSDSGEDVWYIDGTLKRIDPEAIIGWREIHE